MTTKQPVDPVEQASVVLEELARKRDAAFARRQAVAEETSARGYAAHVGNDKPSQARLRELAAEGGLIEAEILALDGAMAEGQARLAQARREAERQVMVERVAEVRQLIGPLRQAASDVTKNLNAFLFAYEGLHQVSDEIRRAGVGRWPRGDAFNVLVRDALQSVLRPKRLATEPMVRPGQRKVQVVVEKYVGELEFSLRRAIDPDAPPEQEALLAEEAA